MTSSWIPFNPHLAFWSARDLPVNRMVGVVLGALVLLGALLTLAPFESVSANGHAVEIFRGNEGSYEIIVRILPEEPVVGTVHFSITPLDAVTLLPVTDSEILIVANDSGGEPTYQARALNTPKSPQDYEANISFESAGRWTLEIEVKSDDLGEATVTVPLNVGKQSIPPSGWGAIVLLAVVAVLVGGAIYVWHSGRRQRRLTDR